MPTQPRFFAGDMCSNKRVDQGFLLYVFRRHLTEQVFNLVDARRDFFEFRRKFGRDFIGLQRDILGRRWSWLGGSLWLQDLRIVGRDDECGSGPGHGGGEGGQ